MQENVDLLLIAGDLFDANAQVERGGFRHQELRRAGDRSS